MHPVLPVACPSARPGRVARAGGAPMVNLVLALLVAGGVFAIFATFFSWYAALVPGALAGLGAYLLLARNAMKQLQALQERAQKELMAQRIDRAVEILKGGFALEKRQF